MGGVSPTVSTSVSSIENTAFDDLTSAITYSNSLLSQRFSQVAVSDSMYALVIGGKDNAGVRLNTVDKIKLDDSTTSTASSNNLLVAKNLHAAESGF
jgi:hypothetical protein